MPTSPLDGARRPGGSIAHNGNKDMAFDQSIQLIQFNYNHPCHSANGIRLILNLTSGCSEAAFQQQVGRKEQVCHLERALPASKFAVAPVCPSGYTYNALKKL